MNDYQTTTYNIADIRISLNTPWEEETTKAFVPFVVENREADWQIFFRSVQQLETFSEHPLFCNRVFKVYQKSSGVFVRQYHNDRIDGKVYAGTYTDPEKKQVLVEYLPEAIERFCSDKRDFFSIAFEKIMIEENAMILHAACVDTPYGGILFSGVSGAGKSTQADLWCQYGQGRLINGDRPILKKTEGGWRAYGSPYAGSSGCHLAEDCKVRAIVLPKQSKNCAIRRISGTEMFKRVFSNLTLNMWDMDYVLKVSELTRQMISEIPVYELECTKEKEAVLVLKELFEKESERWS